MKRRWILFFIGLNVLAAGIVVSIQSGLGVAAFTSLYYAFSEVAGMSLGNASILFYLVLVIFQVIVTKSITKKILIQIPFSFTFGWVTDFYAAIIKFTPANIYIAVIMLLISNCMVGLGIYLFVNCDLIMGPVEASVALISKKLHKPLGLCKNVFDISMVICTILFCLFFKVPFYGVGIGTIISAVVCGRMVDAYEKCLGFLFEPSYTPSQLNS